MRNLFLLTLILSLTSSVFATDLVVENGGINPAYGSIADAVAAASNGDRIIIKNRPGNIPWIEDVTIDKSLEFLSFDNDTFFVVQGNYTILGFAGMKVNIIGMQNLVGNITSSGNVSNGDATVMIMDSKLEQGYMSFTFNNYHLTVAGCELMDGYINLEQGGIYGCEISDNYNGGLIRVYASSSTLSDKSIDIVGNILTQSNTSSSAAGIYWSSQQAYFNISNNFINTNERGIYVTAAIDADSLINQMYNNTIFLNTSSTYGIFLTYATTNNLPILECMNNVIDSRFNTSSDYGLYISGFDGTLNVYYNHFDSALNSKIFGSPTFSGNNTENLTVQFNTDGSVPNGATQQDAGNPDLSLSDIDLSAGDPGAYGGSFTLDNYFPLFNGSARVYNLEWETQLRQGNSLNIKGYSYDR